MVPLVTRFPEVPAIGRRWPAISSRPTSRLQVEALEDRSVPAVISDPVGDFLPTYTGPHDSRAWTWWPTRSSSWRTRAAWSSPAGWPARSRRRRRSAGCTSSGWTAARARPASSAGSPARHRAERPVGLGRARQPQRHRPVQQPRGRRDRPRWTRPTSRINGNEFTASVPLSLMLPAATRPPEEWTYNLWPRNSAHRQQRAGVRPGARRRQLAGAGRRAGAGRERRRQRRLRPAVDGQQPHRHLRRRR